MIPLLRKELAATASYWLGGLAILGVAALGALFHPTLLLEPLGERYSYSLAAQLWPCGFALLLGHGLVSHEVVHGQIQFLDGLPTTRTRVFLAKLVAGVLPCVAMMAAGLGLDLWLEAFAPVPFQVPNPALLVTGVAGALGTLWFYLGLGMLLSWLRGLAFGAVFAMLFGAALLTEVLPATSAWIPLPDSDYGTVAWRRGVPHLDPWPILAWATMGTACVGLSWALFLGPGERVTSGSAWAGTGLRWLGNLGVGSICAILGCAGILEVSQWLPEASPMAERQFGPLHVLYFEEDAEHVDAVLRDAPAKLARLAELLGHGQDLPPVEVEFLGAALNHLGVFTGGKVRVRRDADQRTLYHELGHVLSHEVSGHRNMFGDHHLRFFHEGVANWVAAELTQAPQVPADVGWLHVMDQARFDLLVEDHLFSAEQDMAQAYTLGQVFVDALVATGGPSSLGCTLRAMGRRAPGHKAGLALWYQAASDCDYVLDEVLDAWRARMATAAPHPMSRVPVLTARVRPESLEIVDSAGVPDERTCRFRDDADAKAHELQHRRVEDGSCAIPRDQLAGPTFDYQLGFAVEGAEAWVYHPWVRDVPLD